MTTTPNETTANATGSGAPPQTPLPMAGAEHETTDIGEDMITREIPLRNLLGNTENVRKTGRRTAIQSLVTSIAEIGLLQNLVVMEVDPSDTRGGVPETPKDEALYRVIAGERRLTALRKLADANRMKWTEPVMCTVRTGRGTTTATEVSLVENVIRQRLNPIDECDAFRKLIEENTSLAEIAHRFTVTERHIKQRLKLASLSDAVKQAGREGLITLGVLEAFTVSNDHAAQERVLKQGFAQGESEEWPGDEESETTRSDGPSWPAFLDPTWVKRELNQGLMLTTAPEMRAIGLDTYRARGGELSEDLFTALEEDIPQCVMNPELVQKLLLEKLQSVAYEVAAETPGWKWVEIQADANGHNTLGYGRVGRPASPPPEVTKKIAELEASGIGDPQFSPYENLGYEPEDWNRLKAYHEQHAALADEWRHKHTYTAAERAISGCIIVFRWNGIVIDRGLVKHKDYPAANAGVFAWADETTPPNGEVPLGAGTDTEIRRARERRAGPGRRRHRGRRCAGGRRGCRTRRGGGNRPRQPVARDTRRGGGRRRRNHRLPPRRKQDERPDRTRNRRPGRRRLEPGDDAGRLPRPHEGHSEAPRLERRGRRAPAAPPDVDRARPRAQQQQAHDGRVHVPPLDEQLRDHHPPRRRERRDVPLRGSACAPARNRDERGPARHRVAGR